MVGGADVWESMDGEGSTFTDIGGYSGSIHADQHVMVSSPAFDGSNVRTLYAGNDGGMFCAFDAYNVSMFVYKSIGAPMVEAKMPTVRRPAWPS